MWLNEGWAEFYQTTELRDKEALLGEPSPENIMLLRQNRLLPLPVLLTVDHNSPYYHEENKGSIFYAESWVLTHYLTIHDASQHTHLLSDYVTQLSKGTDSVTAATRAFGDLQKLQQALENYVTQNSFLGFKMPAVIQVDESAFKSQALPSVQADAVRADFLAYDHRTADARALLEEVLKEDPNNASAHETMGFLEFQQGHLGEARKWYGEAVKLDSQSYLAHYYFAVMTMRSGSLSNEDEAAVESSLRAAIRLNPDFAPSYDGLASFYWRSRRNFDEALILSRKAIQLDPGNLNYQLNLSNVLMALRRYKDAVLVLQSAVSLAKNPAEQARAQTFLHNAEHYEAAQERPEQYNRSLSQEGQSAAQKSLSVDNSDVSEPPKLSRRPAAETNSSDSAQPALPQHEAQDVRGPHRFATGTIKNVQCSGLSTMDFVVVSPGGEIAMHSDNYYKIQFSALGFTPAGDMQPCTQIEGRPAKVEFIEPADKSVKDRIVAIELHK